MLSHCLNYKYNLCECKNETKCNGKCPRKIEKGKFNRIFIFHSLFCWKIWHSIEFHILFDWWFLRTEYIKSMCSLFFCFCVYYINLNQSINRFFAVVDFAVVFLFWIHDELLIVDTTPKHYECMRCALYNVHICVCFMNMPVLFHIQIHSFSFSLSLFQFMEPMKKHIHGANKQMVAYTK